MTLKLPDLPYAYDALQPFMSVETLQFHHDKHHQAYVDNGNKALAGTKYEGLAIEEICKQAYADKSAPLINNVGQHWNHTHFWQWMKKDGGGKKVPGKIEKLIDGAGGFDKVRNDFIEAGKGQFGSGWAWLVQDASGALKIISTSNAGTPMTEGLTALLTCDVWEHAYYIDYRNVRPDYISAFWSLVNWDFVAKNLK